jgi:hypothetical protein
VNRTTRPSLTLAVLAVAALVSASPAAADLVSRPFIESESVSHITSTDATLEATINPNGLKTTYQFHLYSGCLPPAACLAITPYPLPSAEIPASSEPQPVSLDLNSAGVTLKPNTRYAYSVEATNAAGTSQGVENQFTTLGPPVIESESVSHITQTDATLEAEINPGGVETSYRFRLEWGCGLSPNEVCPLYCNTGPEATTSSEATWSWCEGRHVVSLPSGEISASFQAQNVSADLNEAGITLQPGTMYRYSVAATNSVGKAEGAGQTFTTVAGEGPMIESESVSHITTTDATLEAQINTEGQGTTYEFLLQPPEPACLEAEPPCMIPQHEPIRLEGGHLFGSFVGQSVSVDLNSAGVSLAPGATYKYWVIATNASGTAQGQPQSFTTPSEAGVEPLAEPSDGTHPQSSTTIQSPSSSSAPHHRRQHRRHRRGLHRSELHRARHAG